MGYWSDRPFSKPGKPAAKSKGYWTSKPFSKPEKVDKCPACGKGPKSCKCSDSNKSLIKTRGRNKGTSDRVDSRGIIWCGVCNSRCNPRNGVCMNVRCSSRKK